MKKLFFVVAVFLCFACSQQEKPQGDTIEQPKIDDSHFKILGFTVGEYTTLGDIQAKMGKAKMFYDEDGAYDYLCYISKSDKTIIVFGFQDNLLNKFMLASSEADFEECDQCTESSLVSKEVSTESGIKLGISKEQVISLLGEPPFQTPNKLSYHKYWQIKMTDAEIDRMCQLFPQHADYTRKNPYWDTVGKINAIFSHNKLLSIELSKISTAH